MKIKAKRAKNKGRQRRSGKSGPRYWILAMGTMGAIVAFTVNNSHRMFVAYARQSDGEIRIERIASHEFKTIDFNIPAGSLQDVIAAFQKKTGIIVNVDNDRILALSSPGVIGNLTIERALRRMLEGTGVSFAFKGPKNVLLNLQAEAASVEVRDINAKVIASPKYTESLRDTPQTISVISKEVIEQQGATTLRDVLNNVPGITLTAGEGGAPAGDNLTIRGFSARNDIYIDGVRDLGAQSRDPFNLEQVEVVKGPSSTFTGRGSTGGTINLVSKLPNLRRSFSGSLTGGTDETKRVTTDINLPVNETVAVRLNLMGHDSNFPGREAVQHRRWGAAPSIIFGLGTRTRYFGSYFYIEQDNTSDYGIPWVPATNNVLAEFRDRPAPVPRSTFYGFIARDKERVRSDMVTGRFEHDFDEDLTVRNQFRYGYSRRDSIATPPRFANNNSTAINREFRSFKVNDNIWDNQTDVTAKFKTGSIEHSVVFGGSLSYERSHRIVRTAPNSLTTLFNSDPTDVYTGAITINPLEGDVTGKSIAAYFFDTIKLSRQWEIVGGLRWDRFDVDGVNVVTANNVSSLAPQNRVDKFFSGRAALIFKPVENGIIYASFGTSANPSLEGLLYTPADVRTDPEKARTFELGTKWDFFDNRLLLTGAAFRVEKTDARTANLVQGEPATLDGDQRVQGIEFSATGNITRDWQIFSGYTFLDSEIMNSNIFSEIGRELINTPRNSFNLWTTYRYEKFFFGGGPRYFGKRFGNNINTRFVDSYVVVDALVSYQLTMNVNLRLNVNNLTDTYYIDRVGGGHIIPGAGRVLLLSSSFSF